MPDLQHLCLNHHRRDGGSVQLPALHVLTALTALAITGDLVARDWFTLPHLRKCDLTDTTLVAQPPAMCTQLESLCINCQVHCFPVQFAELVGLRSLSMPYMCYTHLPPLITQLSNLETLRLGRVGSVGNLDASALGDLSAFPRLQYLEFRDCYVALAPCVGTHLPAMLQRLFFFEALPYATRGGRGVLALHRQLTAQGRPGVSCIGTSTIMRDPNGRHDRAIWFEHALDMAATPHAQV